MYILIYSMLYNVKCPLQHEICNIPKKMNFHEYLITTTKVTQTYLVNLLPQHLKS